MRNPRISLLKRETRTCAIAKCCLRCCLYNVHDCEYIFSYLTNIIATARFALQDCKKNSQPDSARRRRVRYNKIIGCERKTPVL